MTREQTGLRLAAAITMGFGLTTAVAALPAAAGFTVWVVDLLIWPLNGAESGADPVTRLMFAIGGGVLTAWGLMIWTLAGSPMDRDPALMRSIIRRSVLAWFVVDSTASLLAEAPFNLVGNLLFVALLLVPTLLDRRVVA